MPHKSFVRTHYNKQLYVTINTALICPCKCIILFLHLFVFSQLSEVSYPSLDIHRTRPPTSSTHTQYTVLTTFFYSIHRLILSFFLLLFFLLCYNFHHHFYCLWIISPYVIICPHHLSLFFLVLYTIDITLNTLISHSIRSSYFIYI